MPSWAPESWVDRLRSAPSTRAAARSVGACASTVVRSTVTRLNSAATNRAFAAISTQRARGAGGLRSSQRSAPAPPVWSRDVRRARQETRCDRHGTHPSNTATMPTITQAAGTARAAAPASRTASSRGSPVVSSSSAWPAVSSERRCRAADTPNRDVRPRIHPERAHRCAVGAEHAQEQAQGRRLARPVRPEKRVHLTASNLQVESGQGRRRAEGRHHVTDVDSQLVARHRADSADISTLVLGWVGVNGPKPWTRTDSSPGPQRGQGLLSLVFPPWTLDARAHTSSADSASHSGVTIPPRSVGISVDNRLRTPGEATR